MNLFDGVQKPQPETPRHQPKGFSFATRFSIVAVVVVAVLAFLFSGSSLASLTFNVSLIFNANLNIGLESYVSFDNARVGTSTLAAVTGPTVSYGGNVGSTTAYSTFGTSTVIVPANVYSYTVKLWGAGGGGDSSGGGGGGFAQTTVAVTPGETLKVEVGRGGQTTAGGANGGGASTLKRGSTYLAIAGGGGGAGDGFGICLAGLASSAQGGYGGAGGGPTGSNGDYAIQYDFSTCTTATQVACPGYGGTGAAGGAGGGSCTVDSDGAPGKANAGGNGGAASTLATCGAAATGCGGGGATSAGGGGGGGGGRYGGGGGENFASATGGAGGGGGSSLTTGSNSIEMNGSLTTAANTGDSDYSGTAGTGGSGAAGSDGRVVLSVSNPFTTTVGRIGQALAFSTNTYLDYGASSNLVKNVSAESIAFWVKMSATSSPVSRYQTIVDIARGATDQTPRFEIQIATTTATTADIKLGLRAGDSETVQTATTTNASLKLGQWHHVVAISDFANDTATIYVDGVVQTLTGSVSFTGTATSNTSPLYAEVGREANTQNSKEFVGSLDDLRFYNRALSANDVQRLYHLGATTQLNVNLKTEEALGNGLVAYWPFDGTNLSTTTVTDITSNANNGTVGTGVSIAPGKIGQGATMTPTATGFMTVATPHTNFPTSAMTVATWVKLTANANWVDYVRNNWTLQEGSWDLFSDSTGLAYFGIYHSAAQYNAGNTGCSVTLNQWTHLVGTFDGTTAKMYVNGAACGTNQTPGATTLYTAGNITLGEPDQNGSAYQQDDVRLYNRALSATEIQRLYHIGATTQQNVSLRTNPTLDNSLSAYWPFDGLKVSGSTVTDTSGNSVTGTFATQILDSNTSTNGTTTYSVPSSTTVLRVKAWGAGGGTGINSVGGGGGAYATAIIPVTASESLTVEVGKAGASPGGGNGGGASTLKRTSTYLLIAGGGGGGGGGGGSCTVGVPPDEETFFFGGGAGGAGGNTTIGQAGSPGFNDGCSGSIGNGGSYGTDSAGGAGGTGNAGTDGTAGVARAGGNGGASGTCGAAGTGCGGSGAASVGGGGGGGGYYGGGGGESATKGAGGGGGGSSYVTGTNTTSTGGAATVPGNSTDPQRGTSGNSDTDGRVIIYAVKAATGTAEIGRLGQGLSFDGLTTNVTFGASSNLVKNVSAATIAFWAKVNDFVTSDSSSASQYQTAVNISRNTDATPRFEVQLVGTSTTAGVVKVAARAGDAESLQSATSSTATLKEGTWHHIVAVTDYANDTITIYIDGSAQSNQAGTVSFTAAATSNTQPANAELGRDGATASKSFGGVLDDVRIYSRALSAAEVVRLYHLASSNAWNFPVDEAFFKLFSRATIVTPDMALLTSERRREFGATSRDDSTEDV